MLLWKLFWRSYDVGATFKLAPIDVGESEPGIVLSRSRDIQSTGLKEANILTIR